MKKNLLFILFAALTMSVFGQTAKYNQVEMAKNPTLKSIDALAIDFTTTDLDGNTYTLYDYLDSGITVIIDLYATWCSPCWNYAQNGALEDVYTTYGPGGTNEMMVFGIEADPNTDTSEIYNSTLGNWTTGVNYPMINDDVIGGNFSLSYFPYIIMICPNGEWFEAGQGVTAYYTAAEYYAMAGNCVGPNEVPTVDFIVPEGSNFPGDNVEFTDASMGLPTSWSWTFASGTPATSTDQNPIVSWATPGTYDVTLIASNANGAGTAVTKQITVMGPGNGISFEDGQIPADWTIIDNDGDTYEWGLSNYGGSHGDYCISSASWYNNVVLYPDNWLISPMTAISSGDMIKWQVYAQDQSWVGEKYQVMISTTTADVASFTDQVFVETLTASTGYMAREVDLSAYAGQNVYIAFNHYDCSDMFRMNLDEIELPSSVSIDEVNNNAISVYPNPSNGLVNINNVAGADIKIFNVLGEEVASIANANQLNTIDLSTYGVGNYYIKVISDNNISTHVVAIKK